MFREMPSPSDQRRCSFMEGRGRSLTSEGSLRRTRFVSRPNGMACDALNEITSEIPCSTKCSSHGMLCDEIFDHSLMP